MTTMTTKDGRVFELDREVPWFSTRRHCRTTILIWRSACIVCGEPFYVRTPLKFDPARTNAFARKRCDQHKIGLKLGAR